MSPDQMLDKLTELKVHVLPGELQVFAPQIVMSRRREILRNSIATMRKLPKLGACQGDPITFDWPTESDLMSMPLDGPIKIANLKWKRANNMSSNFVGSVQIGLTNGVVSPLLEKGNITGGQVTVNIPDSTLIRKVRGSGHVKEFYLLGEDGAEIMRIKTGNWPT